MVTTWYVFTEEAKFEVDRIKALRLCTRKKKPWPYLFNCLHQFLVEVAETRPELGHIEEEAVNLVGLPGA